MTYPTTLLLSAPAGGALSRRAMLRAGFVSAAALVLARTNRVYACGPDAARGGRACAATDDNIEGPYYLPGAPGRSDLVTDGVSGTLLVLEGAVRSGDCGALAGAVVEIWQADATGRYDEHGPRLRGTMRADAQGRYQLRTIVPGRYLNGDRLRPAHIHVKVHAPGHRSLTTQLYFEGDPYNAGDPWFRPSLLLRPQRQGRALHAERDLVLVPGGE